MAGKSDTFENDLLKLIFNNTAIATIGDASGLQPSAAAGVLYISLHTSDPGEAANQSTNETAYTGYARVSVARTSGGWVVTGSSVSPAANIDFPQCTAAPGSPATYAGIGTSPTGTGKLLYYGALTPNITIAIGAIPRITPSSSITED